ncbi:MAG TPA: class I SAM-dependent methyltransferase [Flavobacterium sp.]|jgi:SAM-dependent methyltransferase
MQHEYYREYYELERHHWWFVARETIICNYINSLIAGGHLPKQRLKILNVGCGPGRSSQYLGQFGEVTSIEYDKFCCEFASEKTGLQILHGSITELPFEDAKFDLVCAFDVVEHVEDDALAIAEVKRVAKPLGVVLITVPAFMSLWSHHDVINHHFRRYRRGQIIRLFSAIADGRVLFSTYFNFFLSPPIFLFRSLSNMLKNAEKRKGSGSDFEAFKPGMLNSVLKKIMVSESNLIKNRIRMPFGVSIICSWKKAGL